jgi:phage gpG-like protein
MDDQVFGDLEGRLREGLSDDQVSRIAMATRASFQAQFQSAGAYGGTPWAMLAESTLRKKRGRSAQILVDTEALIDSLTVPGAPHSIVQRIGPWDVEVGTDLPYAALHQAGTRKMPQRELITDQMVEQEADEISEHVADYVLGGDEGAEHGLLGSAENVGEDLAEGLEGLEGLL